MSVMNVKRLFVFTAVVSCACLTALSPLLSLFYSTSVVGVFAFNIALSIGCMGLLSGLGFDEAYYRQVYLSSPDLPNGFDGFESACQRLIDQLLSAGRIHDFIKLMMLFALTVSVVLSLFHIPAIASLLSAGVLAGFAVSQLSITLSLLLIQGTLALLSGLGLFTFNRFEREQHEKVPLEMQVLASAHFHNDLSQRYTRSITQNRSLMEQNQQLSREVGQLKVAQRKISGEKDALEGQLAILNTQVSQFKKRDALYAQVVDVKDCESIDSSAVMCLKGDVVLKLGVLFAQIAESLKVLVEGQVKMKAKPDPLNFFRSGSKHTPESLGRDAALHFNKALTDCANAYVGYQTGSNRSEHPVSTAVNSMFEKLIQKAVWEIVKKDSVESKNNKIKLQRIQDEIASSLQTSSHHDATLIRSHLDKLMQTVNAALLLGDPSLQRVRRSFDRQGLFAASQELGGRGSATHSLG